MAKSIMYMYLCSVLKASDKGYGGDMVEHGYMVEHHIVLDSGHWLKQSKVKRGMIYMLLGWCLSFF